MKKFNTFSVVTLAAFFVLSIIGPTAAFAASPTAINLGSAGNFEILSKTGVSSTGTTSVVGNIGVSPIFASGITGFALTLPAASAFSTSAIVTGEIYAPDYASPTEANLTTAVSDMQTAYTDGMSRAADVTELGAGNIGGLTLAAGVYKWSTGVTIPTNITLSGSASDVWIFQIAQNLNVSSATNIALSGGAQASNVFWVVAGQTTIGTTANFNGNILDQTAVVLNTGATLNGRALAQSAVTLDSNAVTMPTTTYTVVGTTTPPSYVMPTTTASGNGTLYVTPVTIITPTATSASASTSTTFSGCTSNVGFSTTTGQSCFGNTVQTTLPTYNFGISTLRLGSTGAAVVDLQRFLNAKLNLGLALDGSLGPKTTAVIKTWQASNGLVADGVVGQNTIAAMQTQAETQ